jgi:hypothetical protein
MSQGFSAGEAQSFSGLWTRTFFSPTNTGQWSNLIYRLSQDEYNGMINLTVTPKPDKTVRSLYVLVRLNQTGG